MDSIILIILIYGIPCTVGILIGNYIFDKYYSKGILNNLILTNIKYGSFIIIGLNANNNSFILKCSKCNSFQSFKFKLFLKKETINSVDCEYCKEWSN